MSVGSRRTSWGVSLTAGAVFVLALAAAEGLARRWAPSPAPPAEDAVMLQQLFEASLPFFEVETVDGRRTLVQNPRVRVASPPQQFPLDKAPGIRRIAVVGESSAMILGEALTSTAADGVEVLNCGIGASSLEQVERVAREVLEYSPDAVVLLFGHNLYIRHKSLKPWTYRLGRIALRSRLISLLVERYFPGSWYEQDDARRLAEFDRSLRRVAAACRRGGARLVVCTVPATLWYPPGVSVEQITDEGYLEAVYADWTGRRDAAISALRRRVIARPTAWWYFRLALWYADEKNTREALRFFQLAFDTDPKRGRASSPINTVIRWMAASPDVDVLDLHLLSQEWSRDGLSDWTAFGDQHHVSAPSARREASACWDLLRKRIDLPAAPPEAGEVSRGPVPVDVRVDYFSDMVNFSGLTPRWELSLFMEARLTAADARNDLSALFAAADARRRPLYFVALADAFYRRGERAAAFRANGIAGALAPAWEEPAVQRGEFHLREGDRARARASFARALTINPDRADARYFLSKL